MIKTRTRSATEQAMKGWIPHVDGIRPWCARQHPADDPKRRASKARKALKRLGLHPGPLFPKDKKTGLIIDTFGVGFNVSLAPLWHLPIDLPARAAGIEPWDLAAVVEVLEAAEVRITYAELALDLIGYPARVGRSVSFPDPLGSSSARNMLRLRGVTKRHGKEVDRGSYARLRRSARNLVLYDDHRSKLDPDGPLVLHAELRLQGEHLPEELRHPAKYLTLVQPLALLRLIAQHVQLGGV